MQLPSLQEVNRGATVWTKGPMNESQLTIYLISLLGYLNDLRIENNRLINKPNYNYVLELVAVSGFERVTISDEMTKPVHNC